MNLVVKDKEVRKEVGNHYKSEDIMQFHLPGSTIHYNREIEIKIAKMHQKYYIINDHPLNKRKII